MAHLVDRHLQKTFSASQPFICRKFRENVKTPRVTRHSNLAGFSLRHQMRPSYSHLFQRTRTMYCTGRTEKQLFISIAKGNTKQLDCIGKKSPRFYQLLSDDDLVAAVTTESCLNDFFQLGPEIWQQFTRAENWHLRMPTSCSWKKKPTSVLIENCHRTCRYVD